MRDLDSNRNKPATSGVEAMTEMVVIGSMAHGTTRAIGALCDLLVAKGIVTKRELAATFLASAYAPLEDEAATEDGPVERAIVVALASQFEDLEDVPF